MATYDTQNVITTKSGTGWTVDVTACQLDSDIQLKDFIVFFTTGVNPPVPQNNANFTKLTPTSLQYTGTSIASSTVEVRRKTPLAPYRPVNYLSSISSNDYNQEIERISRRAAEYEVSGVGSTGGFDAAVLDTAYGVAWNGDSLNAPSRNAVYDKIEAVIAAYGAADTTLQGNINTLTTNLGTTNSNLTALTTRVTNVETVNTTQTSDISAANANIATLAAGVFKIRGAHYVIQGAAIPSGGAYQNPAGTPAGVVTNGTGYVVNSSNGIITVPEAGDYLVYCGSRISTGANVITAFGVSHQINAASQVGHFVAAAAAAALTQASGMYIRVYSLGANATVRPLVWYTNSGGSAGTNNELQFGVIRIN